MFITPHDRFLNQIGTSNPDLVEYGLRTHLPKIFKKL